MCISSETAGGFLRRFIHRFWRCTLCGGGLLCFLGDGVSTCLAGLLFVYILVGLRTRRGCRRGSIGSSGRVGDVLCGIQRFSVILFSGITWIKEPYDDSLAATVQVEVSHSVAHRVPDAQPPKNTLEITEAVNHHRVVNRPIRGPADKRRDRGSNPGNRPHAARDLLYVDSRIGGCDGH